MNDDMRGHNQPPEPTPRERAEALVANCNRWMVESPEIASAEQAGRLQGFIDQLRLARTDVEAELKARRAPHDAAIAGLKMAYHEPLNLLGIALAKAKGLADGWLGKEKTRLAREATERARAADEAAAVAARAREAAARAGATVESAALAAKAEADAVAAIEAASKPVERAQIRGELSARAMSGRTTWRAEIVDEQKALKHFSRHPEIRAAALAAVVKVATRQAKETKNEAAAPPGCRFVHAEKAA